MDKITEGLAQLEKVQSIAICDIAIPKIQRVNNSLRGNKEFVKYYSPRLLAIGPIHHGDPNLKLGEHYKLIWTDTYLKENNQEAYQLCQKIGQNIEELKGLYSEDAIKDYGDDELVWMLFVDGCSILQILKKFKPEHPDLLSIKFDEKEDVFTDLHLFENQIPYKVLELLSISDYNTLIESMWTFGYNGYLKTKKLTDANLSEFNELILHKEDVFKGEKRGDGSSPPKPYHLLDYMRLLYLKSDYMDFMEPGKEENDDDKCNVLWVKHKNIREIKESGIKVKRNKTLCLSDVSFKKKYFSGKLKLPSLHVDKTFIYIFVNMIAYEKCPCFENDYDICSYLAFLDHLIDDEKDLKELRSSGVFQNLLGSDKEVVKLLNAIGTELADNEFHLSTGNKVSKKYARVKKAIDKHCRNNWTTWMSQFYNTHFSSPWSILSFCGAVIAILLTAIQTYLSLRRYFGPKS